MSRTCERIPGSFFAGYAEMAVFRIEKPEGINLRGKQSV